MMLVTCGAMSSSDVTSSEVPSPDATLSETQVAILDAVQSVIVRSGVEGASMRQVAEEADVSLGLLSYHFDDKDSLILAAFERATTALLEASVTAAARAEDADTKVAAFLSGSFDDRFLDSEYLQLRISLWAVAVSNDDLAKVDGRYYDHYRSSLVKLVADARPDLDSDDITARVTDVIALTNGLWLDWARFGNVEHLERGLALGEAITLGGR